MKMFTCSFVTVRDVKDLSQKLLIEAEYQPGTTYSPFIRVFAAWTPGFDPSCVPAGRVSTQHRQYLLQAVGKDPVRELYEWLYAMNPLLAGQIR